MDGITILHTFKDHSPTLASIGCLLAMGLLIFTTVFLWVKFFTNRDDTKAQVMAFFLTGITVIGICAFFAFGGLSGPKTLYKVTISEEVPYLEFMRHYEVVDQEGDIYTVCIIDDNFSSVDEATVPTEYIEFETSPEEETWGEEAVG